MFAGCPFGLLNMPSHFQRIMSHVFSGLDFSMPYFDNIPFGSRTWEDHAQHIEIILTRLNQLNLRIKPNSVKVGQSELNCLGHRITSSGIGISDNKLSKIMEWPRPVTGKQLASFLGLITFVRHHVRHFADVTAELESVKRTKGEIKWTPSMITSFELIRHAIANAPTLAFPDFNRPFYLATDASNLGIGGVLYQPSSENDSDISSDNIVAICSKKLNDTQRRYSTYKKELFAIVYCLRQFHTYIWGHHKLIIITDHMPLTHILTSPTLSQPLQQWLDVILDYRFTIRHRPGVLHVLPDALSRMFEACYPAVWGIPSIPSHVLDIIDQDFKSFDSSQQPSHSVTMLPTRGGNDEHMSISINNECSKDITTSSVTVATPSVPLATLTSDPASISSSALGSEAASQARLLVELERRGKRIPETNEERSNLIEEEHLRGHFGRDAIYKKLFTNGFWWPAMRHSIQQRISKCIPCMKHTIVKKGFHPATPVTALFPLDHVQIDTAVDLPKSPDGYTAVLVIRDVCTGYVILRALRDTKASSIAHALWEVFNLFGFPKVIQSDNGPEYVNRIISRMMVLSSIDHRRITPYNPRADGKVEKTIGTIKDIIKKHLVGVKHHWPIFVPWAQSCINNKISTSTGSTPFALMFGRQFHPYRDYSSDAPLDVMDTTLWSKHQSDMMHIVYPAIAERVAIQNGKLVARLDKRHRARDFKTGDSVMVLHPDMDKNKIHNKFQPRYLGPFKIHSVSRSGAYTLHNYDGEPFPRLVRPHHLKFVTDTQDHFDDIYEVDHIMDHDGSPGDYSYLVRWKGYGPEDDTWVHQTDFHAEDVIRDYWKALGTNMPTRRLSKRKHSLSRQDN
jgi:transposase InsO family protein